MSAEDFYKEYYPSKMHLFRDKSDRQLQIFGIEDMIKFAEEYARSKEQELYDIGFTEGGHAAASDILGNR